MIIKWLLHIAERWFKRNRNLIIACIIIWSWVFSLWGFLMWVSAEAALIFVIGTGAFLFVWLGWEGWKASYDRFVENENARARSFEDRPWLCKIGVHRWIDDRSQYRESFCKECGTRARARNG